MTARVLLVEDDLAIRDSVTGALRDEGFAVLGLDDGRELEQHLRDFRPDVVVLDWMLPGRDGPALARVTAASCSAPVIMLTARDTIADRLRGFDVGVDDYLTKPFALAELVARMRVALRRAGRLPSTIEVGDVLIDEGAGVVRRGGHEIALTATELRLLGFLAANRGRVLSTTQILTQVWGYDDYADNLVHVHISALRRKLEEHGPRLVQTVRGLGYVLRPQVAPADDERVS